MREWLSLKENQNVWPPKKMLTNFKNKKECIKLFKKKKKDNLEPIRQKAKQSKSVKTILCK